MRGMSLEVRAELAREHARRARQVAGQLSCPQASALWSFGCANATFPLDIAAGFGTTSQPATLETRTAAACAFY